MSTQLETTIVEILMKSSSKVISDKELLKMVRTELGETFTLKDFYKALMKLEMFDIIQVASQKDGFSIAIKGGKESGS
ncbi:MAG: hypothetical protein ACP5GU_08250 [Thermoprotei archaeon]|jgi:Fe2+ or Zn2+ uptake regulation protein